MEIDDFFAYRKELLKDSKDEEQFISETQLLEQLTPVMLDAKTIDSEDFNEAYFLYEGDKIKINAYSINESGERLQLFLINENAIIEGTPDKDLSISIRDTYEKQFRRAISFVKKAFSGNLFDKIQDSDGQVKVLVNRMSTPEGIREIDVVEVFLISLTATVSFRSNTIQPNNNIFFADDEITVHYQEEEGGVKNKKNILIKKKLIDLNYLYAIQVSRGNREPLIIDFEKTFKYPIEVIKAADETKFESYLCVLPASVLAKLYMHHSSRLLEKNIRSFLQFKGVNKGIKETIRNNPEKFIAYNNGLTITATKATVKDYKKKTYIYELTDFQIVNGGQTTATIYFSKKDGLDISKVKVMAKINIVKEAKEKDLEELISNISSFSNAQSRVSKVDLRSRNPQLIKLKTLSESVPTPSSLKWFFERSKGEYHTKIRMGGHNKNRVKKENPLERRFSKEQLAKYYTAWGEHPYMVKKGGEKVFRYFIERLSGEGNGNEPIEINRTFYEELIAKIILFRNLEKIYGQGKYSIGQIRSVVIPYSISIVFKYTDGANKNKKFDLSKIWKKEGLEENLSEYLKSLMILVNDLIKKYSISEDYGEYSKKKEMWDSIISSSEIIDFMASSNSNNILDKYTFLTDE